MKRFGERPRPRLLVYGFPQTLADAVASAYPTRKVVDYPGQVDETEYDVLVTPGSAWTSDRLFTLSFGGSTRPNFKVPDGNSPTIGFNEHRTSVSKVFLLPPDLPDEISELVTTRLIPRLQARPNNPVLDWLVDVNTPLAIRRALPDVRQLVNPFVLTARDEILAASIELPGGLAECWCLPSMKVGDVQAWLSTAPTVWRQRSPLAFPIRLDWNENPQWATPEELAIRKELTVLENEKRLALAALAKREAALQNNLRSASATAQAGIRKLITTKGDALVDAVAGCLSDLGFRVTDMDSVRPKGDKVEDLRVGLPDDDEWIALVEVKGYGKAAKSNDLLAFTKYVARYGRAPGSCWYIVNQFCGSDPSERPVALAGREEELATFADAANGAVIDTAELFKLWAAVARRELSPADGRLALVEARGRYSFATGK